MTGSIFLEAAEISVNESAGWVSVAIVRTGDLSGAVTIEYGTNAITATAGSDFADHDGFVTLQPGQDRAVVEIAINNDSVSEATETFNFSLVNIDSGTLLFPRTARIDILDDENPVKAPVNPPLVSDYDVTFVNDVTTLAEPMAIEFSPLDPNVAYIAEKSGVVLAVDMTTGLTLSTVMDISAQVNNIADRGLMDIELHPDFANNPYLYAFYVVDPPDTQGSVGFAGPDGFGNRFAYVSRFEVDASQGYLKIVPGSEVVLVGGAGQTLADISGGGQVSFNDPSFAQEPASGYDPVTGQFVPDFIKVDSTTHAGGALEFGPDGALYVTIGDGGAFDYADPRNADVQNLDSLSGKVLRIDGMTGQGLVDNPFAGPGADLDANHSKVYQLGLRNPFAAAFDASGHLYVSETGWFSYEEINTGGPGANFGWPYYEGGDNGALLKTAIWKDMPQAQAFYDAVASGGIHITAPLRAFSHDSADPGYQVQAIVGASSIYTGSSLPSEFKNDYFFTDIVQGEIYAVDVNNSQDLKFLATTSSGFGPVQFKQGPDGQLYYVDLITGTVGHLEIKANAHLVYDLPGAFQHETGVGANDIFVISGSSADYTLAPMQDGNSLVVQKGADFDVLTDFETVRFDDASVSVSHIQGVTITGTAKSDVLSAKHGLAGQPKATAFADNISGLGGNDKLDGGGGDDWMMGGLGKDTVKGGSGDDAVIGMEGNDNLQGGDGSDFLLGGAGNDTLTGGRGRDVFVFDSDLAAAGIDRITDFTVGEDMIALKAEIFPALGHAWDAFDPGKLAIGSAAADGNDHLIYNPQTGALFYDANGSDAGGVVQIAILGRGLALSADDFLLV